MMDLRQDTPEAWESIRFAVAYGPDINYLDFYLGDGVGRLNKQAFLQAVAVRVGREAEDQSRYAHLRSRVEVSFEDFALSYAFALGDSAKGAFYLAYTEALLALGSARVLDMPVPREAIFRRQLLHHATDVANRLPSDSPRRHYLYSQVKHRLT